MSAGLPPQAIRRRRSRMPTAASSSSRTAAGCRWVPAGTARIRRGCRRSRRHDPAPVHRRPRRAPRPGDRRRPRPAPTAVETGPRIPRDSSTTSSNGSSATATAVTTRRSSPSASSVAPRPLHLRVPADLGSLAFVRDALRSWLDPAPLEVEDAHDVVLAAWEACANAIEHAESPTEAFVDVFAELDDACVRVRVKDSGRWVLRFDRRIVVPVSGSCARRRPPCPSTRATVGRASRSRRR